jgi:hypothetical protein
MHSQRARLALLTLSQEHDERQHKGGQETNDEPLTPDIHVNLPY